MSKEDGRIFTLEQICEDVEVYIADLQTRLRMGTYDPKVHGTLEEVLDEIARLLR